jgi:transcriptional regulator with XRE-family HTH domain
MRALRGEATVEDHKIVQRNLALQREWYGEPLGDRVRRLVVAFDVSQANLADVLGISAPMLSQVMSGRRAKIGNPQVLARLIMLERKVFTPDVAAGKREALQRALDDVRESRPSVTRDNLPVDIGRNDRVAIAALRRFADPGDLAAAADLLNGKFPDIADLLRRAGRH